MGWSKNIGGKNFTEEMFAKFGYVQNLPLLIQAIADVGEQVSTFTSGLTFGNSFRNKLYNATFWCNQRGVSGTVTLAPGNFGHDGVKAGQNGCTYTFSKTNGVTTINILSGSFQQNIEGPYYITKSGPYTLSWEGTAEAQIQGGAWTKSPMTINNLPADGNVAVEWRGGTVALPQFEPGTVRTAFEYRDDELRRCQRYFQRHQQPPVRGGLLNASFATRMGMRLNTEMRVSPTIVMGGNLPVLVPGVGNTTVASIVANLSTKEVLEFDANLTASTGGVAGQVAFVFQTGNSYLDLSAEL